MTARWATTLFLLVLSAAVFCSLVGIAQLAPPLQIASAAALIGVCIGSFANVVIWRLPIMLERAWHDHVTDECAAKGSLEEGARPDQGRFNLAHPPSACPLCATPIACWHNVPILSYLWLRGRCAKCQAGISARYPIVEAAFGLAYGALGWHFGLSLELIAYAFFFSILAILFAIDSDTQLLPDALTQPLLWSGLLVNAFGLHTSLEDALFGAVAGFLVFWIIAEGFKALHGKDGMGRGDLKLLAALGAWLGWQPLPFVMAIGASLSVLYISVRVLIGQSKWSHPHAFGPHLILGGATMAVHGALFGV